MNKISTEKDLDQFTSPKMVKTKRNDYFRSGKIDTGLKKVSGKTFAQKSTQAQKKMKKKYGKVANLLEYLSPHENIVFDYEL